MIRSLKTVYRHPWTLSISTINGETGNPIGFTIFTQWEIIKHFYVTLYQSLLISHRGWSVEIDSWNALKVLLTMSLAQLRVSYWVNFFIKKNVNSTKDYGFENSNDKWFFVIYSGLNCLEMYLRLISPIRFFTFLLYLWSPLV